MTDDGEDWQRSRDRGHWGAVLCCRHCGAVLMAMRVDGAEVWHIAGHVCATPKEG
jgi:hypothetical protein